MVQLLAPETIEQAFKKAKCYEQSKKIDKKAIIGVGPVVDKGRI